MVKDRKSSTITLLLENRKPLRQPNLIQPPPLSAPYRPPSHHHPAPKHADKTSDTAPLSSFDPLPPPTACLLASHVYILLPHNPPLPMCRAQTSSKAVYGHLSPKAPSSSPTLVPIITNLQLFLFIHERHPPPQIDIAIYDGSDSLLIAGSIQTQLLCVPFHIKCICQ